MVSLRENLSSRERFMNNTNVKVEFRILGDDFEPDTITNKLVINPNEYWKIGDTIKNKNFKRKYSCWSISTGYEESLDINEQLKKILLKISDKKDVLKEIRELLTLEYRLDIIINIEGNEKPAIYLDSETIEFANDIKAEFDFDLYINS